MIKVKISSKRQATFSKAVCESLGLQIGDEIVLKPAITDGEEKWTLRPAKARKRPWLHRLNRYAIGKDHAIKSIRASTAKGETLAVSDLVVAETYFALQHHYQVPRQEALDTLRDFLEAPEVGALGVAQNVLAEASLARANPSFVDRLIHADYLASTTGMLSFEKTARKLPPTHLPK